MELTRAVRAALSEWISFLLPAVSSRSHRTLIELLMGCLVSPEGWVTRAIGAIDRGAHWTTYYKLIERAQIPVAVLAGRLLELVLQVFPQKIATLIIDDTLVPRGSALAPGVAIRHDHARKRNRPTFLNCQCWVSLALVIHARYGRALTIPLRSWLIDSTHNRGKLGIARELIESLRSRLDRVRVLFDAWYMRRSLIEPLLAANVQVLGQVRRDSALFLPPEPAPSPRRGRPRKYGRRLTPEAIAALPLTECELPLYGKMQRVRLRSALVLARFLRGVRVRAVWCEMLQRDGAWSRPRLLIATETQLSAEAVVRVYAKRWGIEPLFHNLKRWWGCANLWQHSREALELWMQIRCTAYALMQMLALIAHEHFPLMDIAPWRRGAPITAGLLATWMRVQFTGVRARAAYQPKSRKFILPEPAPDHRLRC